MWTHIIILVCTGGEIMKLRKQRNKQLGVGGRAVNPQCI